MASPAVSPPPGQDRRLTRGARRVLVLLQTHVRPVAAKELWNQMRAAGEPTGLATVYRALHALAAAGVVHQFHHDTQTTYRVCGPGPHDHLICRTCGRVQERPAVELEQHIQQLNHAGFTADEGVSQIYGQCSACP